MYSSLETPSNNNYSVYRIPKGNGKIRVITAPSEELKDFQKSLMDHLETFSVHDSAHGFVKGRSISTNAFPHVGNKFVLSMDLKDFFPSVKTSFVKELFSRLNIDERYVEYVTYKGGLPQGSPCSPVISNLYCHNLDVSLKALADDNNLNYTRYADDLTFSGSVLPKGFVSKVKEIVKGYSLRVHPKKTKVMWRNQRQVVTGVIVNDKLNMPVEKRKKMRALKHQYDDLKVKDKRVLAGLKGFDTAIYNGKIRMEGL